MNIEFSSRFEPCSRGCHLWFLVGGRVKAPGLEMVEVDGIPVLARKVRPRWRDMLLKEHTPVGYGDILVQLLGEAKVREVWPQYYFPWQHNKARRQNRRDKAKGVKAPVNLFRSESIRACAKRSIV